MLFHSFVFGGLSITKVSCPVRSALSKLSSASSMSIIPKSSKTPKENYRSLCLSPLVFAVFVFCKSSSTVLVMFLGNLTLLKSFCFTVATRCEARVPVIKLINIQCVVLVNANRCVFVYR